MTFPLLANSESGFMNFSTPHLPRCPYRPRLAVLGVALAVLSFSGWASNPIKAPDRKRVEAAVAQARSSAGVELITRSSMSNARGQTIVHASQAYQGHRVWGAEAVVHADHTGQARIAASSISSNPVPAGTPVLRQDQAVAIARKAAALKVNTIPAKASLVVFPTKYHGGIKLAWNPALGKYTIDRANSVMTLRPTDPYVWAWEVQVFANNATDGIRDMSYVIDARTGAVMHVDDGVQRLDAPRIPHPQDDTDLAVVGTGYSQWSGTVSLNTTQHADGTFGMIDRTRGSQYNPYLHDWFVDENGNPRLDANGNQITTHGMQVLTETHELDDFGWGPVMMASAQWCDENLTNTWGDGRQFVMFPFGGETSPNGQTAAVDAYWGMGVVWDFYKNVFGRDGIDNLGTSTIATVHNAGFGYYDDYAFWDTASMGMFISDGTRNVGFNARTGGPSKPNPNGYDSLTTVDIIGHEVTHGVTDTSAGLQHYGEPGAIGEATSDFMGSMIEAYAKRAPGTDSVVPETGTDWLMYAQATSSPVRSLINPNYDGVSPNNWYNGIQYLDTHYNSGPMRRFFYVLAQGASSDKTAASYSPYLPGGMAGIGNDKTARIWYTALTEFLKPMDGFFAARDAGVNAAIELYGDGSTEVAAVKSAFAAINVGSVDDTPRVSIDFAIAQPNGSLFNPMGDSGMERIAVVAMTTTVKLTADVQNATDTSVKWKLGGMAGDINNPGFRFVGGTITDDGAWTPDNTWGFHAMTVVSNADPMQFAEGAMWVIDGDADGDTEFDAIDLGGVALSWGIQGWVNSTHSMVGDGWVDSYDVEAINQAFKNAFGGI